MIVPVTRVLHWEAEPDWNHNPKMPMTPITFEGQAFASSGLPFNAAKCNCPVSEKQDTNQNGLSSIVDG